MKKGSSQKQRKEMAAELGRRGGRAIVRKRGKAYMGKLAKLGGKARWAQKYRKAYKKQNH